MVVEQINCGAPGQVAMNVTVLCTMCTAHDIIWLFYYSTFKCKNIFTFHIFGFALSMLRHGRESGKQWVMRLYFLEILVLNTVKLSILMDIFLEILVLKAKYCHWIFLNDSKYEVNWWVGWLLSVSKLQGMKRDWIRLSFCAKDLVAVVAVGCKCDCSCNITFSQGY